VTLATPTFRKKFKDLLPTTVQSDTVPTAYDYNHQPVSKHTQFVGMDSAWSGISADTEMQSDLSTKKFNAHCTD